MRAYLAFTKKELLESLRTYKVLIILMIFISFGMLAPLTAKLTPKLLELLMTEGMQITLAEPIAIDSWAQFFKTISQMGFIVVIILFSNIMANEFNRGTFVNILTKGLPRSTVIFSKFTVASIIFTASYLVSFSLSYLYTSYFWGGDKVLNLLPSIFYLWLFGILLLAIIMLGGVIFRSSYGCLMFVGSFIFTLFLLNIVPKLQIYNPIALASKNMSLLTGNTLPKDLGVAVITSIAIILLSIFIAIRVFNKKNI